MSRVLSLSLLVVVVVVVVVTAAPPSPLRTPSSAPHLRLKRANNPPKSALLPYSNPRGVTGVHRPYSAWKHLSSVRRYRYPLYRKRNSPVHYDYDDDLYLPEDEVQGADDEEYPIYTPKPSLFRERNYLQHQLEEEEKKEEEEMMGMNGYFHDTDLRPFGNAPERFNGFGRTYGEDLNLEDFPGLSPRSVSPTATGRFYDALSYVRKRATQFDDKDKKQGNYLSAAGRYWKDEKDKDSTPSSSSSFSTDIKRRKRNTTTTTTTTPASKRRKTNIPATITTKPTTTTATTTTTTATMPHDARSKRAFSDYFKWEKRQQEEEEGDNKDVDDYLTREYFKTIARSVGQKRMAYGQFEPDFEEEKRAVVPRGGAATTLEDLLNDPETLRMIQDKLREAEMVIAQEAGSGLSKWPEMNRDSEEAAKKLMANLILRFDAIEHMREELGQLQDLQQGNAGTKVGGRRRVELREIEKKRGIEEKKKTGGEKRSVRRRLRRDDIGDLFLGNEKEECPVLWWILQSCTEVSEKVGDEMQVFLPACIRHEICYSCGASQGISGHECDAILSSALEASCPARSLDCLSAAGSTFTALSRPSAYDQEGGCANDSCVIHYLEAR